MNRVAWILHLGVLSNVLSHFSDSVIVQFFVSLNFEINPTDKEEHKLHKVNDAICYYFHLIYFVIFLES